MSSSRDLPNPGLPLCEQVLYHLSHQGNQNFCQNLGLNQGPLDLQSNALPTEIFQLDDIHIGFPKPLLSLSVSRLSDMTS